MKKLLALLLLLPILSSAEPQPWMKKDDPEKMKILVLTNSVCPATADDLQPLADDALIRARIRPYLFSSPIINAFVNCIEDPHSDGLFFVVMQFEFTTVKQFTEYGGKYAIRFGPSPLEDDFFYGNRQDLLDTFRDQLENVVTDYLKANFDLGDEE